MKRGKELRCQNLRSGHAKDHQDENGKPIGSGQYQSAFSPEDFGAEWIARVKEELTQLERKFREKRTISAGFERKEVDDVFDIHRNVVADFYGQARKGSYLTNATCLCCLMHPPEVPLRCGHALCTECIQGFNTNREDGIISIEGCPFHVRGSPEGKRISKIKTKPILAGVRVLTLDG